MKRSASVLGVDLGGSHCSIAFVNKQGKIIDRHGWPHEPESGPDIILDRLIQEIQKLCKQNKLAPIAIGMGLPGNIDSINGVCKLSPNLFGWKNIHVGKILSKKFEVPVKIGNDVRIAALGEARFGAGMKFSSFLFMAIGTGIGGGIIINKSLWVGAHNSAGEIGHITIEPDGPLCNCGNRGCLEALASGPAISAMAASGMMRHRSTLLAKMVNDPGEITAKIVAQAAEQNDPLALECFMTAGKHIGIALASLVTTLDVERIVLGGGVSKSGDILIEPIYRELEQRVRMFSVKNILISSKLGRDAGIIGAASIAYDLI